MNCTQIIWFSNEDTWIDAVNIPVDRFSIDSFVYTCFVLVRVFCPSIFRFGDFQQIDRTKTSWSFHSSKWTIYIRMDLRKSERFSKSNRFIIFYPTKIVFLIHLFFSIYSSSRKSAIEPGSEMSAAVFPTSGLRSRCDRFFFFFFRLRLVFFLRAATTIPRTLVPAPKERFRPCSPRRGSHLEILKTRADFSERLFPADSIFPLRRVPPDSSTTFVIVNENNRASVFASRLGRSAASWLSRENCCSPTALQLVDGER